MTEYLGAESWQIFMATTSLMAVISMGLYILLFMPTKGGDE